MPRRLGQHFLTSPGILEQLASAACGGQTPRVVEIGPGKGALTNYLLPRTPELHAIELDFELVQFLQKKFASESRFHVHHADVLEADLSAWGPAVITGNLPYYITSPIIEKFLALDGRFPQAVFLMQLEVAERILAKPKTRDYGYLTVSCQLVCDVQLVCKVPPGAFSPPPKVDSAGVLFKRRAKPPANIPSILKFASRAFAQKRKNLRNNLKPFYGASIETLPEASLRAEQLSVEQLVELHNRLVSYTETS